jgi:uncharacterized protein YjbI with pentapeptide repeats
MKMDLRFSNIRRYPLLFIFPLVVGLLFIFYRLQQNNVNILSRSIRDLHQQIETVQSPDLKVSLSKDLVGLRKDQIALQNKIYETLLQGLGGAFFFVTAYLTWRNLRVTEEKHITERFSQALGFLEKPELEFKLSGIYSLERIAKDSQRDYLQIIDILTSYIRSKDQYKNNSSHANDQISEAHISREVQTILSVLHRLNSYSISFPELDSTYIDLSDTRLGGAYLNGVNFDRARFNNACLRKANLHRASLCHAEFCNADLTRADLKFAVLNHAELRRSIFCKANLWKAQLKNVDLAWADLQEAKLQGAQLQGANFKNANLKSAKLQGAQLQGANFKNANLFGVNLSGSNLLNVDFSGANLENVDFSESILTGAIFVNTIMDKVIEKSRS